ncbi:hypothetical protein CsatA_025535 [Cannabis sativa]|uniref:RNase H type-1 domain-containing protein n=1 Tax=Cannabis sativa TaxID=3483 RepID=A0A803Q116_CANSA
MAILGNVIFNVSFQMVILKASELLSKSEFELFLFTSWSIWKERNNVTHGGTSKPLSQIVSNIKRLFEEHIKAWNQRSFTNCSPCNSASNWSNPPYGQLKLNVDAAIDESSRTIGIGAILRNSNGDIVACFSKPMFGNFSVLQAECMAIVVAVDWIISSRLEINIVESDCLTVISAFNNSHVHLNDFGSLLEDVAILFFRFPRVSLIHVRRMANTAADGLAVHALRMDEQIVWLENYPSFVTFV